MWNRFFICKFNGNGLFSLIKLRGNCIVVSSLISDDDVGDTSTAFDNVELLVTIIDGIDDDERWFEELWWDDNISIDDEESDSSGGDGANGWESTETVDDCVSKHIKHYVLLFWCENHKRKNIWIELDRLDVFDMCCQINRWPLI